MRAADLLQDAFHTYHQQVGVLEPEKMWSDQQAPKKVLALLRQRDRIQHLIDQLAKETDTPEISPQFWMDLSEDDAQVDEWNDRLLKLESLPTWRKSLKPPEHHWWWYPQPAKPKPILGWLLGGLTIALLTITLALAKDIATRFFTGAPGIWSSIGAISPVALALFATGGVLTKVGQQIVDAYLSQRVPYPRFWPLIKFSLAVALLALFFWGHSAGLPWAATQYHALGTQQYYEEGKLADAQGNFERALQLNPNFPAANHDLAVTYEDLQDFEQAKAEYAKAIKAGYLESVNNLARLQISEDEDFESAAVLLKTALDDYRKRDIDDPELKYGLHKNLGWAWFRQERLLEAQGELIRAIRLEETLEGSRPDAHCLLAQVLEAQEKTTEAQAEWETCLRNISRPEDDVWKGMANKALSTKE
ncbi:MAG: tetratricopeptide repeat protein [Cyanobacteria bacterium P01_D01_bin.156]